MRVSIFFRSDSFFIALSMIWSFILLIQFTPLNPFQASAKILGLGSAFKIPLAYPWSNIIILFG